MLVRLSNAIALVCPIHGVSIGLIGDKATWKISFKPEATANQIAAANEVVQTFDTSPEAESAWKLLQEREAAKSNIVGVDASAIRFRAPARLELKILKGFSDALLARLVANARITQAQADNIKAQIPTWVEFQTQLSAEIDADVANG